MGFLRFLFRNWPLKLAAVGLATLLYAGLIVSATASTYTSSIPITIIGKPAGTYVLPTPAIPDVTDIRYLLIGTKRPLITSSSFTATIDLSGIKVTANSAPISVPVTVTATDSGTVQILGFSPARVQVRLDPQGTRIVPVIEDHGLLAAGIDPQPATIVPASVSVSGPVSYVNQVATAVARIRLQTVDFSQDVDLIAVDGSGEEVKGVTLSPRTVAVTVPVNQAKTSKSLPVVPAISGTPAADFSVTGVTVVPSLVTISGAPDVLAPLTSLATEGISIDGLKADLSSDVALILPAGVTTNVTSVQVTVAVAADTGTRSYQVGLVLRNGDPSTTYAIEVDHVVVTLGGTIAALNKLDPTTLAATLSVGGLGPGAHALRPALAPPANLTLVSISPQEVTVIVTPAPTPTPAPPSAEPTPVATSTPTPEPSVVP
jgi:YbbR domain-containing protein